jgi:DNA-nicking Smr family endonuclease
MALRRRTLTEHDRAEWANYARRIAPLRGTTPVVALEADTVDPVVPRLDEPVRPVRTVRSAPQVSVGGHPGGIDTSTWKRFSGGKLPAVRRLDLHGQTTQRAFHSLITFIRTAHADHVRCVEVITGRGSGEQGGAIKREFPIWLNLPDIRPLILAASHPHAANPGSVRLLLRRVR